MVVAKFILKLLHHYYMEEYSPKLWTYPTMYVFTQVIMSTSLTGGTKTQKACQPFYQAQTNILYCILYFPNCYILYDPACKPRC